MDETFLTTEEVLAYLQVNLRTVYRLIKAGKIPAVRVGRQWRFRKRDIDAWLDSQRPRGGSRAAAAASSAPPAPVAAPRAANERPRILVVDDESSIRDLLAKTLALAEYDVDTAADGRSALERLRLYPYDLLIADLKMPGIDGLSVIREAKRLKVDLPVIIITGYSTETAAIEAVNLGVSGYLTKPFRVPQVLAAAAKAIGEPA
jgi:excisionase family DNA binding protein